MAPEQSDYGKTCAQFWQELRLPDLQQQLDVAGLAIAEQQEAAAKNRRQLADATREFKRSAPEATHKGVGPLLRSYQEEIDRLTRRAKHGENAFLELYQKLYEAPDPAPALAMGFETASRVAELELENRKLSTSLHEYQTESTVLKNQDGTIRKLEEKVRMLEATLEERGQEVAEIREQAIADADAARAAQAQEREMQLTQMLMEARGSLAAMQKLHHASQNQLFAMQSQSEEEKVGRQHELELATAELERAQERLMALEREKEQMVSAAEKQKAGPSDSSQQGAERAALNIEESMRQELYTQREIGARLRAEIAGLRQELEESGSMWAARVEGLKATIQATEQHARAMEEQLAMRPTNQQVEELRQQVRMLHAVSCNSVGEEEEAEGETRTPGGLLQMRQSVDAGDNAKGQSGGFGSLEALLLQKNRHLEHELTMARLKVVDTTAQLDAVGTQVADLEAQLSERQVLISRLEDDLLASRTNQNGAAGASQQQGLPGQAQGLLGYEEAGGSGQQQQPQEDSSMIKVVCNQRDR
uniref:Cux N-terminal domain-containing protein n=1 Tax=Dunaliella tertiolecta TaxID=3047 RepID=A0A7S3QQW6_DUNTE